MYFNQNIRNVKPATKCAEKIKSVIGEYFFQRLDFRKFLNGFAVLQQQLKVCDFYIV